MTYVQAFCDAVVADLESMRRTGFRVRRAVQLKQLILDGIRLGGEGIKLAPSNAVDTVPLVFELVSRYCDLSLVTYTEHVQGLARDEVTAHFEGILRCLAEAQETCSTATVEDWATLLGADAAQAPALGDFRQRRNRFFVQYMQEEAAVCIQLQECCRCLMDHVVSSSELSKADGAETSSG